MTTCATTTMNDMGISQMTAPDNCEIATVDVARARELLTTKSAILVDVREDDEHARERIKGSRLLPLSRFDVAKIASWVKLGQSVVMQCKSGKRAAEACRISAALQARGIDVVTLKGGIEAWKAAGYAIEFDSGVCPLSVMRQVQLSIGAVILIGSALAWFIHPAFVLITAFCGLGMTVAGATGTCGLASILAAMPWNQVRIKHRA